MEQIFNIILLLTFGSILLLTYIDLYRYKAKLRQYITNGIICIILAIPPFAVNIFIWKILE